MSENLFISIIGSACRNGTHNKIRSNLYYNLCNKAIQKINEINNKNNKKIIVVSGGAAFCDHIAITLYLYNYINELILYLPSSWNNNKYSDTKCGNISNYYHNLFSEKVGFNSLEQIQQSINKGAHIYNYNNFYLRNKQIALSSYIIAFGWDKNPTGGTLQTLNLSTNNKIYITI